MLRKALVVLEEKLKDLKLSSDEEEAAELEGKAKALEQLEEQLRGLEASQEVLENLLSKLVVKNSGFQAGTINGGVSGIHFGGHSNLNLPIVEGGSTAFQAEIRGFGDGNSGPSS